MVRNALIRKESLKDENRNAGFAIDLPHDPGAKDYIGDINAARNILKLNKTGKKILCDLVQAHAIASRLAALREISGSSNITRNCHIECL